MSLHYLLIKYHILNICFKYVFFSFVQGVMIFIFTINKVFYSTESKFAKEHGWNNPPQLFLG